jgi:arylsulfatase
VHRRLHRSGPRIALAALAVCSAYACGAAPRGAPIDLLARAPDEIHAQPGGLKPTLDAQWGAAGLAGWEHVTHAVSGGGHPFVYSKALDALLELEAGAPRDRELALRLWVWRPPGDGEKCKVHVRLNDVLLGELSAGSAPALHRLPAPEPAWREGSNVLSLSVDRLAEHESGALIGLALASVRYDQVLPVRADPRAERLELAPDTGVRYDLSTGPGTEIHLRGTATGAGTLEVALSAADPGAGLAARELSRASFAVSGAELAQSLVAAGELPEGVLSAELTWRGANGSRFAFAELAATPAAPVERPPVILIAVDTLAAANMSLYGYARATTPELEALARQAVTFERCTSNSTWTVPSFMALMSGLYSGAHAVEYAHEMQTVELWEKWHLAENRWTLAEALRGAGYATAGFVDSLWLTERFGLAQGFDAYDASAARVDKLDPEGGIRRVTELAKTWLESRPDGAPFFLFLHCFDVHGPYSGGDAARGRFRADAAFEDARELPAGGAANVFGIVPEYVTPGEYPDATPERASAARLRAAYDEGVALVDAELGAFFRWLDERGILDPSLIVVTADHGEALDRGPYYCGHGLLEEAIVHVPLLVKLPGGRGGGTRIAQTVQSVDVHPTVLELAGIQLSPGALHGRSLAPLFDGGRLPEATTLCECGIMEQQAVERGGWRLVLEDLVHASSDELVVTSPRTAELVRSLDGAEVAAEHAGHLAFAREVLARVGERGMTPELLEELSAQPEWGPCLAYLRAELSAPVERLHWLAEDPEQEHDLSRGRPDVLEELRRFRDEELGKSARARAIARAPSDVVEISAEERAELEKLGYAGSDGGE